MPLMFVGLQNFFTGNKVTLLMLNETVVPFNTFNDLVENDF